MRANKYTVAGLGRWNWALAALLRAGGAGLSGVSVAVVAGLATLPAAAQVAEDAAAVAMKRETMTKLLRRVTIDLQDQRLEDVVQFIETVTQTDLDPIWADDQPDGVGLDKDFGVTLKARNLTALALLEQVLDRVNRADTGDSSTWQFTPYGAFEFGPREALNRRRFVVVYDLNDMLVEVPDYTNAPDFDLQSAFQNSGQQGGGGGGQSPFQQNDQEDAERRSLEDRLQQVVDILVETVEPEQWADAGGSAATWRDLRGSLIVNAPDYIHRQINGYPWWPSTMQRVSGAGGTRAVTFDAPTGLSQSPAATSGGTGTAP